MDNERKIYTMLEKILRCQVETLELIRGREGIFPEMEGIRPLIKGIKESQIRLEQKIDLSAEIIQQMINGVKKKDFEQIASKG